MNGPDVLVLACGGTIDKIYTNAGELVIGPPAATALIGAVSTDLDVHVESVLAVDSLDMTDADRTLLAERVRRSAARRIIVTHGTDSLTQTAEHLLRHRTPDDDRVVVLTGAMQPAAMRVSDAAFNIGAAVIACQLLDPGVHVCMSGRIFAAGAAVKDRALARFVPR